MAEEKTRTDRKTTRHPEGSARRVLSGVVVSDKMDKTVVVAVTRYVKHPKYKKFTKHIKRYKAHDPENTFSEGDSVQITECRPQSKEKSFRVVASK